MTGPLCNATILSLTLTLEAGTVPRMPHGPVGSSLNTRLAVECPACGHYTEKPLPWLKTAELMECGSCGMSIDLASGERREEIDKLYENTLRDGC